MLYYLTGWLLLSLALGLLLGQVIHVGKGE